MNRVSSLICDPFVRAAFERAERDEGRAFCLPAERPRTLDGGTAERIPESTEERAASLSRTPKAVAYA